MRIFARTLILLLLFSGCQTSALRCRTEFLSPAYLASQRIGTPDPRGSCFFGQQIVIQWQLPGSVEMDQTSLLLHVRFCNKEHECFEMPIKKNRGWTTFALLNEAYFEKGGILSFKVVLFNKGKMIEQWNHFLWSELIEI